MSYVTRKDETTVHQKVVRVKDFVLGTMGKLKKKDE